MKFIKKAALILSLTYTVSSIGQPLHLMASEQSPGQGQPEEQVPTETPEADLQILAPAAVLMDARTGVLLYAKNKDASYYPASITKILTALITLESTADLTERIKFTEQAVLTLPYGSSHIAMDVDETLTVEQALYGLMLESANDVANALAEHFGGNNEDFGRIMTSRAKSLGAVNSNFTNPHGLHAESHYTTAYDMALIMREAIKLPMFNTLISTKSAKIPPTERQPEERPLNNSNQMIYEGNNNYYEHVVGGKTGYTTEAGNTLVTYAKKDNMDLICVVLHEENYGNSYTDTKALFDYGFERFGEVAIFDNTLFEDTINIVKEVEGTTTELGSINVVAESSVSMYLPVNVTSETVEQKINMAYQMAPPVSAGDVVGTLTLLYDNMELTSVNLISATDFADTAEILPVSGQSASGEEGGGSILLKVLKTALYSIAAIIGVLLTIAVTSRLIKYRRRKKRQEQRRARARYLNGGDYSNYRYRNN